MSKSQSHFYVRPQFPSLPEIFDGECLYYDVNITNENKNKLKEFQKYWSQRDHNFLRGLKMVAMPSSEQTEMEVKDRYNLNPMDMRTLFNRLIFMQNHANLWHLKMLEGQINQNQREIDSSVKKLLSKPYQQLARKISPEAAKMFTSLPASTLEVMTSLSKEKIIDYFTKIEEVERANQNWADYEKSELKWASRMMEGMKSAFI